MFKIIHLSDLHFGARSIHDSSPTPHSVPHLKGIEKLVKQHQADADLLVITGDLSDLGDENSLLLCRQWLFNSIEIGNLERIELGIHEENYTKIQLIPGNHDAWNSRVGSIFERRQDSLRNFNTAFPEFEMNNDLPNFYWLEKDDAALFLVFLDSSFLADDQHGNTSKMNNQFFDKVAKGKITKKQTKQLLELYDQGMSGKLSFQKKDIQRHSFNKALKIVVLHHYLFEPPGEYTEPLLELKNHKTVFSNLVLADFDILLCGHKHVSSFDPFNYKQHLDTRARYRYILNYFRRIIGVHSLPIQLVEDNGKKVSKLMSLVFQFQSLLQKKVTASDAYNKVSTHDAIFDELTEILAQALENPSCFEMEFNAFLSKYNKAPFRENCLDFNEIKDLENVMKISLSFDERAKLKQLAFSLKKVIKKLSARQFVQVMAGSACKRNAEKEHQRSFNIYSIQPTKEGFSFQSEKFDWNVNTQQFDDVPLISNHEFNAKNRPRFAL